MITDRFRGQHVHLLGIGGSGVSALAPLLASAGATVSGCDSQRSAVTERLAASGMAIHQGHGASHLPGVDLVVHTSAVRRDHPELQAARDLGIPVMGRGECLVELMRGRRCVAVAGSHGKTSTTWMLGHLLAAGGCDPLVMVGGAVASLGGGARVGAGAWFVAETDESDGSFARVEPLIAIVTNLDREHLDHWGSYAALEDAFHAWLLRIPAQGSAIVPASGLSPRVTEGLACRVVRCGLEDGEVHATRLELGAEGSRVRVSAYGADAGEIDVPLPGGHMVANALMAVAAARLIHPGLDLAALASCERVRRRFTVHGTAAGVRVVEDYGHHPAEVRATISAARLAGGRVHVVFQPHRYSRTRDCCAEFIAAFDQVQSLVLLPIYAASEAPIPGVSATVLAQAIRERRRPVGAEGTVAYAPTGAAALALVQEAVRPGDTVLVLGAGDVGALAPLLLTELGARDRARVRPFESRLAG